MKAPGEDRYLLAHLEPETQASMESSRTRSSPYTQGSLLQNLRRVAKVPDTHRSYIPGDPVARIDWAAYGRTDQLLVRETREPADTRMLIVVDAAGSMQWPDSELNARLGRSVVMKFEVALRSAMHLQWLLLRNSDKVRLVIRADESQYYDWSPLRATGVVSNFSFAKSVGFNWGELKALVTIIDASALTTWQPTQSIVISDLLNQEISACFPDLSNLTVLHMLSSLEVQDEWLRDEFNYLSAPRDRQEFAGDYLRKDKRYLRRIAQWQESLREELGSQGIGYHRLTELNTVSDLHFAVFGQEVL